MMVGGNLPLQQEDEMNRFTQGSLCICDLMETRLIAVDFDDAMASSSIPSPQAN